MLGTRGFGRIHGRGGAGWLNPKTRRGDKLDSCAGVLGQLVIPQFLELGVGSVCAGVLVKVRLTISRWLSRIHGRGGAGSAANSQIVAGASDPLALGCW